MHFSLEWNIFLQRLWCLYWVWSWVSSDDSTPDTWHRFKNVFSRWMKVNAMLFTSGFFPTSHWTVVALSIPAWGGKKIVQISLFHKATKYLDKSFVMWSLQLNCLDKIKLIFGRIVELYRIIQKIILISQADNPGCTGETIHILTARIEYSGDYLRSDPIKTGLLSIYCLETCTGIVSGIHQEALSPSNPQWRAMQSGAW